MNLFSSKLRKVVVQSLQIHATQACNFSCDGCTSFSQFKLKGMLSVEEAKESLDVWKKKIHPKKVCLLGGEPTLNPNLCELLILISNAFPAKTTNRILTTNASFIDRHPKLEETLRKFDIELRISLHSDDAEYLKKMGNVIKQIERWRGVRKLFTNNSGKPIPGFKFNDEKWTQRYRVDGKNIFPFDHGNPRKSWEVCPARVNIQLYDGKLWKCPIITYFRLVPKENRADEAWEKYLNYEPLLPTCSHEELKNFISREEEEICGMCPSETLPFRKTKPF